MTAEELEVVKNLTATVEQLQRKLDYLEKKMVNERRLRAALMDLWDYTESVCELPAEDCQIQNARAVLEEGVRRVVRVWSGVG